MSNQTINNTYIIRDEFNQTIDNFYDDFLLKQAAENLYVQKTEFQELNQKLNTDVKKININIKNINNQNKKIIEQEQEIRGNQTICVYRQFFSLYYLFKDLRNNKQLIINNANKYILNNLNQKVSDLNTILTNYYDNRMFFIFTDAKVININEGKSSHIFPMIAENNSFKLFKLFSININGDNFSIILTYHEVINNIVYIKYYLLQYLKNDDILIFKILKEEEY